MTLNELTRAAAARLRALWPDRPVYVDDIPREADGCLYIGLIDSEQGQELDRRFKRSVSFQILYFRADQDALAYGTELSRLLGRSGGGMESEARRIISEALLADDRVTAVRDFTFTRSSRRTLAVSFTVETTLGDIAVEREVET